MPWGFPKPSGWSVAAGRAGRWGARREPALPPKARSDCPLVPKAGRGCTARGGGVHDSLPVTCLSRADRAGVLQSALLGEGDT